jgi:hypothetical protein
MKYLQLVARYPDKSRESAPAPLRMANPIFPHASFLIRMRTFGIVGRCARQTPSRLLPDATDQALAGKWKSAA